MDGVKFGKRKLIGLLKALVLAIMASVLLASEVASADVRLEIDVNGTFALDESDMPAGWSTDAYIGGDDNVIFEAPEAGGPDGKAYVRVVNVQPNDARWIRTIAVQPETFYRLSALVRAEAAEGTGERESGANLSVLGVIGHSEHYAHTDGQWVPIEFIGKTGATQTEMTVALRLGGYGALIAGTAEFANFTLEALGSERPAGTWSPFYPDEPSSAVSEHGSSKLERVSTSFLFWTYAIGALGLLLGWRYVRREDTQLTPALTIPDRAMRLYLAIVFAAGILLRIVLSLAVKGHPIDMLDFAAWADRAYLGGLNGFFAEGMFADYPPGYIYVLYALGWLRDLLGLTADIPAAWLLLKLPAIAADVALASIIAILVMKRWGAQPAMVAATFLAFNPMTIAGSSLWGQVDSVLALLLVLFVLALTDNRTTTASLWLTVAVLVKPQAIVLAPLLFLVLYRRRSAKHWAIAAGSALAALVVLVLPFEALRDPAGLLEHYKAMFTSYPYASLNAANAYGLFGLNAAPNGRWIGPMTVSAWSNVLTIAIVAFIVLVERRFHATGKSAEGIPVLAMLLALLVFTLRSGMHERYGFAAAILALLACAFVRSNRLRMIAAGFTLVQFANIAYVLEFGLRESYYVPVDDAFFRLLSFLEVVLAGWAAFESWRIAGSSSVAGRESGKPVAAKQAPSKKRSDSTAHKGKPAEREEAIPAAAERRLTRRDAILMAVLTFVGGAIGFYRIGTADAPHTVWYAEPGLYEQFSLNRTEYVAEILVYTGLGNGSLELEKTTDGVTWSPALTITASDATVFQWQRIAAGFEASAIRARVPAVGGTATFYELSLRDANNDAILPETPSPSALFDEPDAVPSRPSYMNSMYFDEIYHARTAYEHANGIEAYETTHPPLGKVIMSAGISLFGMNPFGWRFMGTLIGMLTIPLLYVFGKRMFGRTEYAALAGGLIALDFMRFSLSRIGTVDIFAVFFIALAAFAMYEYYRLSVIEQASPRRALIPLAASAIAIGMAIATKWIGLYAGLGLAVTLLAIWRSPRFPRGRYGPTLAWTAGLFTLGPLAVYLASYIPFLNLPGPGHGLGDVISYQRFMFNYHSDLVATHPFSSSWWQWPLIERPVWAYAGPAANAGDVVSIVLMGNPAIWWIGSAAAVYMAFKLRSDRRFDAIFLLIGLAAQLVPWMFVSRLTFIYHFYASVPFIILCTVYAIRSIAERAPASLVRYAVWAYAGVAAVLFAMFYPILAGADVDRDYVMQSLKWYKSWILSL